MTSRMTTFLDAQTTAQLSLDDLLATLEAEEGGCEFERECRAALNMDGRRCGWLTAGTVRGCAKRKKYLNGGVK
jgi:hypothetical protein